MQAGVHGAEPATETAPDYDGLIKGKVLEQALGNAAAGLARRCTVPVACAIGERLNP